MSVNKYRLTKKACYLGYIIQAVVCNLLPLLFVVFNASPYGISLERLGRLIFINFIFQLIVDFTSIYFVPKIGYKRCVVLAQATAAVGFVLLSVLPQIIDPYYGIVISIMLLAVGSGLIEVLISPIIEALPSDNKAGSMSLLHSFYSWGQVITVLATTLLLLLVGRNNWFILPLFWATLPLTNTILFAKSPIKELKGEKGIIAGFKILKNRRFILFMLLMLAAGASEIAMSQWASFFVEVGFDVPKWLGDLLGPCAFAVLMGTGRILFGIYGKKLSLMHTLLGLSGLTVVCYFLVAFSDLPIVSVIGCALCGLAVSVMWPGVLSLSAANFKTGGTAMFSLLAMFGDLGCSIGPWLVGFVADYSNGNGLSIAFKEAIGLTGNQPGMQLGFLITGGFPLIMFIILAYCTIKHSLAKHKNN